MSSIPVFRDPEGVWRNAISLVEIAPEHMQNTFVSRVIVPVLEPLAGHAGHCAKVTTATITGRTDVPCSCETPDDDDWAKNIYQDTEGKFVMGKTKKSGNGKRGC